MKDTPTQAEDRLDLEAIEKEEAELKEVTKEVRVLTPNERAMKKHRFFSGAFFVVSAVMLTLIATYEPMLQNALLPSVAITVVTCLLGVLNLNQYKSLKADVEAETKI